MILIAPDKFKGTMTAPEVTLIVEDELTRMGLAERMGGCFLAPMADGGEGTSDALCYGQEEWEYRDRYYSNLTNDEVVLDSSAFLGLHLADPLTHDIMTASSAPLGRAVRRLLDNGASRVAIAIGGTNCCDGGVGFLESLGPWANHPEKFMGLADVEVPLLEALMFAPQKGAKPEQLPLLRQRLLAAEQRYGPGCSPFDGAGGGLGYAIASVIGAECHRGADYVMRHYDIPWDEISMIVTGEGRIDGQTSKGKVVEVLRREALRRHIPLVAIGGTVGTDYEPLPGITRLISTLQFLSHLPLTPRTARIRLRLALQEII